MQENVHFWTVTITLARRHSQLPTTARLMVLKATVEALLSHT